MPATLSWARVWLGAAERGPAVLNDLLVAAQLLGRAWFYVPIGILAILATTFGVNKLLQLGAVSFPASCLVKIIGENLVVTIEILINVFFTPSFILLSLSPSIGGIEVLKIMAVFVIGFLVMMALAAYMTRVLQVMLGSSKRAMAERAEELGTEIDEILMTTTSRSVNSPTVRTSSEVTVSTEAALQIQPPPKSRVSQRMHQDSRDSSPGPDGNQADLPAQVQVPPSRATRWALAISSRLNMVIYILLFTFVGILIHYTVDYAMPLQLAFSILTYFVAMSIPTNWRQYLHPVLVSSLFTVLGLWVLGLIKAQTLDITLREFHTGATYLKLWDGTHQLPGAGDIFASILDASIVSLALPMYQYRRELRQRFLRHRPPKCGHLHRLPRSLAFAARSLTLALATPAVANLGGDSNTAAALAITSGIVGVLVGQRMLALPKIPDDGYVTRGVTLGVNSSAIAIALLLRTDPRAAALSGLSMSLFGVITVLFTSLPPIVAVVRSLVAL
ncbi:LrgB-like family-domain-containing protein [Xylaria acuta]|nr:LrgB-like family-domain-containing protein [Xylaria acuta]